MGSDAFGRLVKALRDQTPNDEGSFGVNQKLFENQLGLSHGEIGRIERGEQASISTKTLVALADYFHLTSKEREKFFNASLGLDDHTVVRAGDAQTIKIQMYDMLNALETPAFLVDTYSDLVAANAMAPAIFGLPMEKIAEAAARPAGFNVMRLMCDESMGFVGLFGERWYQYARINMQFFRAGSLRYRASDYFNKIFKALWKYPRFRNIWLDLSSGDEVEDHTIDSEHYCYFHKTFQRDLNYYSMAFDMLTAYGEMHLVTYLPASPDTAAFFVGLSRKVGKHVVDLSPWPEKR